MIIDLNQIINTVFAGGAIYAGIHFHIKFLWRDVERLTHRVNTLERKTDK